MEQPPPLADSSAGGAAPFLLKTYDMIDDSSTDEIVSWSSTNSSFIVWNPPDFSSRLLPTYFKHNNFSSFIRQLNTYGFHKIDPERWEFANEEFAKGKKHLLKSIHRRKPIHSHSQPAADAERAALEEEIENLHKDKARLQADSWRFEQQHSSARIPLDDLEQRMRDMEQRQEKMAAFIQRAAQNPRFVESIVRMAGTQDFSTLHRKRRLPEADDCCAEINSDDSFCENSVNSSRSSFKVGELGDSLNRELCDKLKLGLCPRKSSFLMTGIDDGLLSCHLDLTLASSSMQTDRIDQLSRIPSTNDWDVANVVDQRSSETGEEVDVTKREAALASNSTPVPATGKVNDKFWEQFLTERPGSSDTEEASSSLKGDEEEQEEMMLMQENNWRNIKDMEQLTL